MNRLVVVSNRVPLPSAGPQAGGLAVALDGMMERRGGVWFGWSGKVAPDAATKPLALETQCRRRIRDVRPHPVRTRGLLQPLLQRCAVAVAAHDAGADASITGATLGFTAPSTNGSRRLSSRCCVRPISFGSTTITCFRLRRRCARGTSHNPIGFFLHIPFAPADVLAAAPEMASLVRDMLAADLIGFQTDNDLRNFAAAAQSLAGAIRLPGHALQVGQRRVRLGVYPVEIEPQQFAQTATEMAATPATERLRRSMQGQSLILGVDRLDPTKGLLQRLAGLRTLFDRYPDWRRRASLLQIAATSRKEVSSYRALRARLDQEAGALNADLGDPDWSPLRLITRGVSREVGAGYMRLARVGLVTPVRDGMNLVAKEFVAAQDPEDPGVLVLSHFAGAARQLGAALLVNPHDADAMADALHMALRMSLADRKERWRTLWSAIEDRTPLSWGRSFVSALLRAAAVGGSPIGLRRIYPRERAFPDLARASRCRRSVSACSTGWARTGNR